MIYKHDKYPGVSENGVYPLDNFSIYGWKNDNPLEIFDLGISDFSMNPSGSRSVVLWDRSADAKLRRGGRRPHGLNESHICRFIVSTLWWTNIAMENGHL